MHMWIYPYPYLPCLPKEEIIRKPLGQEDLQRLSWLFPGCTTQQHPRPGKCGTNEEKPTAVLNGLLRGAEKVLF